MKIRIVLFSSLFFSVQSMNNPLLLMPDELQKYLCFFLIEKNPKKTNDQNCIDSVLNLRKFLSTCKKFYSFLNNKDLLRSFVDNLDHDQKDIKLSKIMHATYLNTHALNNYVENILNNNPDTKARLINLLVITCFNEDQPKKRIEFLSKTGISLDDDNSNFTPLTAAASWSHIDKMALLLESGADINKKNPRGNAALHEAVSNHHIDAVRFLIEKKANINIGDKDNDTALIKACKDGFKPEIVELLLQNNADRSLKNNEGKTAEEIARSGRDYWVHLTETDPDYSDEWMSQQLSHTQIVDLFKKYPEQS